MEKTKFSYQESIAGIEEIIARLRDENPDIDTLAADVKRATDLIAQCRAHLLKTETEVEKILQKSEK